MELLNPEISHAVAIIPINRAQIIDSLKMLSDFL